MVPEEIRKVHAPAVYKKNHERGLATKTLAGRACQNGLLLLNTINAPFGG